MIYTYIHRIYIYICMSINILLLLLSLALILMIFTTILHSIVLVICERFEWLEWWQWRRWWRRRGEGGGRSWWWWLPIFSVQESNPLVSRMCCEVTFLCRQARWFAPRKAATWRRNARCSPSSARKWSKPESWMVCGKSATAEWGNGQPVFGSYFVSKIIYTWRNQW